MRDFDRTNLGMDVGETPTLLEVDWTPRWIPRQGSPKTIFNPNFPASGAANGPFRGHHSKSKFLAAS